MNVLSGKKTLYKNTQSKYVYVCILFNIFVFISKIHNKEQRYILLKIIKPKYLGFFYFKLSILENIYYI
jgi:hypothetical protein